MFEHNTVDVIECCHFHQFSGGFDGQTLICLINPPVNAMALFASLLILALPVNGMVQPAFFIRQMDHSFAEDSTNFIHDTPGCGSVDSEIYCHHQIIQRVAVVNQFLFFLEAETQEELPVFS